MPSAPGTSSCDCSDGIGCRFGALHSGICGSEGISDASPSRCGNGSSSSQSALRHGGPNPEVLRRVPGCQRVPCRVDGSRRDGGVRPSAMPLRCGRDPDGPATGRQRPAGWWQRVQTLRVLGEMARGRKTLESEKLVWGWKTRFWSLTSCPGFEPQLSPLSPVTCEPYVVA